jgi:hypothetical protein
MATRVKTIEFATTTINTTLAAATNRDLTGSTSIYIPETGGTFAFVSVILQVECTGDNAASASLTAPTLGITLGAVAISTAAGTNPVANSGEQEEWTFTRNVTSYFTTNWTGTNMAWYTRVNFSGIATCNHSSKIIITYQYDDANAVDRQIKTIRIPIESTRTLLTTTYQTIGGATAIPALTNFGASPYLPETGITIRQIFLELWGQSGIASTGQFTITIRINGTTTIALSRAAVTLNSAPWYRMTADISALDLSAARSLEAIVSTTTSRVCTFGGQIVVTYEFNTTTSTTIYNSLMLGAVDTAGWIGGTTATDQGVWERNIYIEEPDTITFKESGLCLYQNDSGGYTFNVRVSGDTTEQTTVQAYVNTAGTLQCGNYSMIHRIDAGGQKGQNGISLVRGKNLYRVCFYSGTAQAGWNLSGYLILNYTSGKHPDGVGVHAHSVYQHVTDNITAGGSRVNTSATVAATIPETYYYLLGYLFWVNYSSIGNGTTGGLDIDFTVDAEVISTDLTQGGDGWVTLYNGTARNDSDNMNGYIYAAARNNFTRWNGDTDSERLDIKTSRKYRLSTGPLWTGSMGYWYTYNAISYVVSGTCTGYSGDGSGIPVDIYRVISSSQDEMILNLTTSAGGTFSGFWIDNTDTLYATARQDDSHVGRSTNGIAG